MSEMGEMHANLMRAACLQPAFDEACERARFAAVAFQHAIAGPRGLALCAHDRHALAIEWIAADIALDDAFARARRTPRRSVICALDRARRELAGEARHRAVVFRCNQEPARVLVRPRPHTGP